MLLNAIIEKDKNGYFAYVPNLKGCVSQGETYEEALLNIKEAIELYIESLQNKEKKLIFANHPIIAPIEVSLNG
jgi:predicted RNase H-like HicB family nuclease